MTGRSLAAVIGAAGGPPGSAAAISPLGRYLTDPGAVTAHAARVLLEAARHQGPVAGPLLAAALTTVAAGPGRGCGGASTPPSPRMPG